MVEADYSRFRSESAYGTDNQGSIASGRSLREFRRRPDPSTIDLESSVKIRTSVGMLAVAGLAVGTGLMSAEAVPGKRARYGTTGADVAVCDLPAITRWGSQNGITAYSLGTTSVNLGDVDLLWISSTNEHPRIPQNAFRFAEGRLTQIAQSWCKDGFCALQQEACGACTPAGVGCRVRPRHKAGCVRGGRLRHSSASDWRACFSRLGHLDLLGSSGQK